MWHTLKRIPIWFKEETKPGEAWAAYFPVGGPVVRILRFHHEGPGSIAGWETKIPHATWCSQKKKKRQVKIWHLCYHYISCGVMVGIHASCSFGKTPVQTISHFWTIQVKIPHNVKYHLWTTWETHKCICGLISKGLQTFTLWPETAEMLPIATACNKS